MQLWILLRPKWREMEEYQTNLLAMLVQIMFQYVYKNGFTLGYMHQMVWKFSKFAFPKLTAMAVIFIDWIQIVNRNNHRWVSFSAMNVPGRKEKKKRKSAKWNKFLRDHKMLARAIRSNRGNTNFLTCIYLLASGEIPVKVSAAEIQFSSGKMLEFYSWHSKRKVTKRIWSELSTELSDMNFYAFSLRTREMMSKMT